MSVYLFPNIHIYFLTFYVIYGSKPHQHRSDSAPCPLVISSKHICPTKMNKNIRMQQNTKIVPHANTPSTFSTQRSLAFSLISFGMRTSTSTCLRCISPGEAERHMNIRIVRTNISIQYRRTHCPTQVGYVHLHLVQPCSHVPVVTCTPCHHCVKEAHYSI